jgi:hypothetical protein
MPQQSTIFIVESTKKVVALQKAQMASGPFIPFRENAYALAGFCLSLRLLTEVASVR